ncbi:MAG: YceI family protein [Bacteroidetes bacterium]|jgi:polyisoprenoid-binding protein YceI|nr:YceI family protein [Bacteroidota bacterium]PKP33123.1 MAG: YceI family protein [Bacteroidetes bacterium HGW-Bacteroidetes-16]
MKSIKLTFAIILFLSATTYGQRYITKTGHIWFHSEAPLETIEAHNNQVNAVLDIETGEMVFKVLMKSFIFEKALMQEHFNENYVESDKYPNATFQGKVTNLEAINFTTPGTYNAQVTGKLTIHNQTNNVGATGTFEVKKDVILGMTKFNILIADYNISIPGAVAGKIADEIDIHVDIVLKELKK